MALGASRARFRAHVRRNRGHLRRTVPRAWVDCADRRGGLRRQRPRRRIADSAAIARSPVHPALHGVTRRHFRGVLRQRFRHHVHLVQAHRPFPVCVGVVALLRAVRGRHAVHRAARIGTQHV